MIIALAIVIAVSCINSIRDSLSTKPNSLELSVGLLLPGLRSQIVWLQVLALPFASCVVSVISFLPVS